MTRVLHRPRHDEAALLDATVHAAPVEKPRGVPARPLAGRPGIAADVLRELRADIATAVKRAPFVKHEAALHMHLAPIAAMLDQPDRATDWLYLLGAVESAELTAWSRTADAIAEQVAL